MDILRRRGRLQSTSDGDAIALTRALVKETQDELVRADSKASTLLAGALVAIGILGSAVAAGQWPSLHLGLWLTVPWLLAMISFLMGLACLLAVIYPRYERRQTAQARRQLLGYYSHVAAHSSTAELAEALRSRARQPELERLAEQLDAVARLAWSKYQLTRLGIWSLSAASFFALTGGVSTWLLR